MSLHRSFVVVARLGARGLESAADWAPVPPFSHRPVLRRRLAGFSLVELLVVLAIVMMILSVGTWSYKRLNESAEYRETIRLMATDLGAARRDAAATGKSLAFIVDLDRRVFGVEGRRTHRIPQSLEVRVTAANIEFANEIARIRFFPTGNATGGNIEILRRSGAGVRLQADWLDGRISMQSLAQ